MNIAVCDIKCNNIVPMGTLQAEDDAKRDLDDSGCVQDESPSLKKVENGYIGQAALLDLSDDVLLYILKHCSPRDLKALGYTCPRLGSLILDHTLWQRVDARSQPSGRARLKWLISHALNSGTKALSLSGFAREASGCLGLVNRTREEAQLQSVWREHHCENGEDVDMAKSGDDSEADQSTEDSPRQEPPYPLIRQHARLHFAETLPRFTGTPSWPDELSDDSEVTDAPTHGCGGPLFTLNQCILSQLRTRCSELSELRLEYCNINCKTTDLNKFPATLKKLSLRGAKCYNLPLDKSFLFRISDFLPHLEYLDVSECEWLEPASLLPISKMTSLVHLLMRHCYKLSEFVAYASLACRFGFNNLKILDLSGSPVGDSEVSALGWISDLEELYLSPPPHSPPSPPLHKHYKGEALPRHCELDHWETEEPEYFKKMQTATSPATSPDTSDEDLEGQIATLRRRNCLHHAGGDLNSNERMKFLFEKERYTVRFVRDNVQPEVIEQEPQAGVAEPEEAQPEVPEPETPEPEVPQPEPPQPDIEKDSNPKRKQENGSVNDENPGPSSKRKKCEEKSEKTNNIQNGKRKTDSESSNSDSESPKRKCININQGASTSTDESPKEAPKPKVEQFVRFRQNQDPVIIHCPAQPELIEAEPRQHILYVNVGQQLRAIYRRTPGQNRQPDHLDSSSLVTDSSVRRFGRANGEDINYVHIGPHGPGPLREHSRPNRSNLRVLSITGYRRITDRSLVHLATAAPNLRSVDFTGSSVTQRGADAFRALRPDCLLTHSAYVDDGDASDD